MALIERREITAWYKNTSISSHDFAKQAYEDAVKYFEQHLTNDNDKRDWIRSNNSLEDVLKIVQQAQDIYHKKHDSKARRHIYAFASRVQYYGSVFDVLAQHHPEYVALAWGAIKFIFIVGRFQGVLNHAELVTEISKGLFHIADSLPMIKLGIDLYPTIYMREVVSRVYAHIMLFLEKAVKWYSMSPARRAISALAKPYTIGYKDAVDQIKLCAESVNMIASAATRAEIRDQTIKLQKMDKALLDVKQKTQHIFDSADASQIKFDHMLHLAEDTAKITSNVLIATNNNAVLLQDIQFSKVMSILKPKRAPEDMLYASKTVASRRQLWKKPTQDSARFIHLLDSWINANESAMFVLQASARAEARAKDLAVQATTLLRANKQTVLWNFSERWPSDCELTLTNILRSLLFQAITQCGNSIRSMSQLSSVSAFQTQHDEHEWVELLAQVLGQLSRCFLVIEMEDLLERLVHEDKASGRVLQVFEELINKVQHAGGKVKVLLVYNRLSEDVMDRSRSTVRFFGMCIRQPVVTPPRYRRRLR